MSEQSTSSGIRVTVRSQYLTERSNPMRNQWFFIYHVRITNHSPRPARLLNRRWIITNAEGAVSEVRGAGVVGEQPRLEPGEHFEYTSACPLDTPFGTMRGSYEFADDDGNTFDVPIPAFTLAQPHAVN